MWLFLVSREEYFRRTNRLLSIGDYRFMNEFLFFTPEGNTTAPNANVEVENCQLLGRIRASSADEARKQLLIENPWIDKAGFTVGEFVQEQIITEEQLSCIRVIVDYLCKRSSNGCNHNKKISASIITSLRILDEMVGNQLY